ncbi:MAG: PA domain-containing protein [Bacteroidota bacterium]
MKKLLLLFFGVSLLILTGCSDAKSKVASGSQKTKINVQNNKYFEQKSTEVTVVKPITPEAVVEQKLSDKAILENNKLRELHACYLAESPYKEVLKLSKKERKAIGLVPNKYYETEWENSINPALGRPTPENLKALRIQLEKERNGVDSDPLARAPGDAASNSWVERGPTNVGGRTRAIMFDPNDASNETVFAGGVSGGLWKNTNISNANSTWTRVNIPENLAISCISVDPNNSSIFYVGTGESYVGGDVNGDGVWKSTDGGATWANVFGGISGATYFQSATNITVNSPVSSVYSSVETTAFGVPVNSPITADLVLVNDGSGAPTEACGALPASSVLNKIALIRRGNCNFVQKIINAKNAGAIAVIVMNNIPGNPAGMGGVDTNSEIDIPSVAISKDAGDALVALIGSGAVNVTINPSTGGITGNIVPGNQHINDIVVRNNGGVSEIYVAAADGIGYGAYLGGPNYGLFKSVNGGSTWTEVALPLTVGGLKHCPNDIEITSGNKIWLATTNSFINGDGGGKVFSSADGVTFVEKYAVASGQRTQIAVSKTNPNKVYVLAQIPGGASILKTIDNFATTTALSQPADADPGVPATDFTRGQAFYDLLIAADPTNDETVYVGGIDLFKSTNGGGSFNQFTHWYGGFGYQEVHADQHAIAFGNGASASTELIFGNDGGVYYSADGGGSTTSRNKGFNVTQFYSLGVAPSGATGGNLVNDYFAAGAQDNGSQYFASVVSGANASTEVQGGDGAFTMFDQGADKYYITNYVYNQSINRRTTAGGLKVINSESTSNGAFITPMVLDSNLNILYSDYSSGTTYQIRRYTNVGLTGTVAKTILTNALLTAQPTAFAVSKYTTATTTLLVGTRAGKLLRLTTANASAVWADISSPLFLGTVSDVEFGESNNEIFVTFSNYGVTSIWYTANGTAATPTWVNKEGNFPDIPVKCILQNPLLPTTEVIIGTELGVWYTNNFNAASPIWRQSYNGMRNVKVTDLDLRNDNMVFAATFGRGIFSGLFTNTVLSNEAFVNNKNVSIYPNPVKDVLNINVKDFSSEVSVKIIDINGREVYSQKVDNINTNAVNLSNLSAGVYVLKLQGENLNYSEKIILE